MSTITHFDRPHVQHELSFHMFKNTSLLQCVIPNSSSQASPSPVSSIAMNSTLEPVAPSPSPIDPNIDHITSLERSLCSDFVCCGAHLPDLHALLEHFEEDHIMLLTPNGKRVYPQGVPFHPLSLRTSPSSSRSSSVLSSPICPSCPLPTCPSSPSDLPSRLHGTFERRKSSIAVAPIYTPFTPSLPVDPTYPYPDSTEIDVSLYDFSQDFYSSPSHFDDDDEDMSDISDTGYPTSPIPTCVYGLDNSHPVTQIPEFVRDADVLKAQIPKTVRDATLDGLKGALRMKNTKVKNRQINSNSSSTSRRREKAYRCPTPRCTKSYLNPNGLKYHLEKGTCKIENEYESETGEESNLQPSSAPWAPSSPTVPQHPTTADVGSYCRQQRESEERESESGPTHRQSHQYYPYSHQYSSATRPLYPATPIAVSSHDQ